MDECGKLFWRRGVVLVIMEILLGSHSEVTVKKTRMIVVSFIFHFFQLRWGKKKERKKGRRKRRFLRILWIYFLLIVFLNLEFPPGPRPSKLRLHHTSWKNPRIQSMWVTIFNWFISGISNIYGKKCFFSIAVI